VHGTVICSTRDFGIGGRVKREKWLPWSSLTKTPIVASVTPRRRGRAGPPRLSSWNRGKRIRRKPATACTGPDCVSETAAGWPSWLPSFASREDRLRFGSVSANGREAGARRELGL
jgi:hypothetical protein